MTTPPRRPRRAYIDWVRGVAVVIMIFGHTMDSWTRDADRPTALYRGIVTFLGIGTPLFLFLAGVSVALAAGARVARGATPREAAEAGRRRGAEIFALGLLFRLQAWILSPGATAAGLLKVDILNIMGPAIALAAALRAVSARLWPRLLLLAATAAAFSLLTPIVRRSPALSVLPDVIEWYLRPRPGHSWFALFPWAGLLVAGTLVGELIERSRDEESERRLMRRFALAGAALVLVSFAGSYLPSLYANTYFWTTSPSFFFLRIGLMVVILAAAWRWRRNLSADRFSPLLQFGRTSLFVYWIHVEMVYGVLSHPLHRALPIGWAFATFGAFTVLMLGASVAKDRWWRGMESWRSAFSRIAAAAPRARAKP
jgi:uncharacterized membrane protein